MPDHLLDTSDDNSVACCPDRDERCTLVPMVVMIVGLICMVVGFAVPRAYEFDPKRPAREMESVENFYIELSYNLDICITVGMGFVALGGIIVSVMMLHEAFSESEDDGQEESFDDFLMMRHFANYGTATPTNTSHTH